MNYRLNFLGNDELTHFPVYVLVEGLIYWEPVKNIVKFFSVVIILLSNIVFYRSLKTTLKFKTIFEGT